jgi:branched-chain amino acid transport system permease protein
MVEPNPAGRVDPGSQRLGDNDLLLLQIIIAGIAQGCVYGLIALGFVLIYKATETVNFAQGDLMMLGAFAGLAGMTLFGWPFWLAAVAAGLAMALLGLGIERVIIRQVLAQPQFSIVMLTFGLGYVIRGLVTMVPGIGTDTHSLPVPYKGVTVQLGARLRGGRSGSFGEGD